jgi:hypothetical protein
MEPHGPDRSRGIDRGRWDRSQPVARIADEYGDGIRVRMAVDGGESHLTEHGRLVYRPADHSRNINILGLDRVIPCWIPANPH